MGKMPQILLVGSHCCNCNLFLLLLLLQKDQDFGSGQKRRSNLANQRQKEMDTRLSQHGSQGWAFIINFCEISEDSFRVKGSARRNAARPGRGNLFGHLVSVSAASKQANKQTKRLATQTVTANGTGLLGVFPNTGQLHPFTRILTLFLRERERSPSLCQNLVLL